MVKSKEEISLEDVDSEESRLQRQSPRAGRVSEETVNSNKYRGGTRQDDILALRRSNIADSNKPE